MNVTFRAFDPAWASTRLRAIAPQAELRRMGIDAGRDWLVIGKHGWDWQQETQGFGRVCFDVCDDHFGHPKHGPHYRQACAAADLITCNSAEMARVIRRQTGLVAEVIPEPYEQPERYSRVHQKPLWFGHVSNLPDLRPWIGALPGLEIVCNIEHPGATTWTPNSMDEAFDRAGLVVLPTGKSMAKSANRAVEAIRRGLFVVAGYLPAYADLGIYIGDISDGVAWTMEHDQEVLARIAASQAYVRSEYAPQRIARAWLQALGRAG